MKNNQDILRSLYSTVFSQKFSSDGNTLAVGDNFGYISIYKLNHALSAENINKKKLPYLKIKAQNSSVYSLESCDDFLVSAPLGKIQGWKWTDLNQTKNSIKPCFSIDIKTNDDGNSSTVETNCLLLDLKSDTKRVYAGCGDGQIYNFDLESGRLVNKYNAHEDSIYQVISKNNQTELISVGEDGEVKIWDLRKKNLATSIKPYNFEICARPHLGKHINCVAMDDENWLICGGGPRLTMWHLRSMKPMSKLEFNDDEVFMPNVCQIHENQILSGGNCERLFIHTFENKIKTEISTSINCIYDIEINLESKRNRILCVSGSGPYVDICSNFSYKANSLSL